MKKPMTNFGHSVRTRLLEPDEAIAMECLLAENGS